MMLLFVKPTKLKFLHLGFFFLNYILETWLLSLMGARGGSGRRGRLIFREHFSTI